MPTGWEFKTSSGKRPEEWWLSITKAAEVNSGDIQYAGDRQKSRILERTARGVDVDEKPFAPYSKKGPYYWYPSKVGNRARNVAATHRKLGGAGQRTRFGIKFESYEAFTQSIGRAAVDLMGPRAPHMLQAIVVKVTGLDLTMGIYGDEAKRASGHNFGTRHLPKRHFFGASAADLKQMAADVYDRMKARIKAVF